MIFPYLVFTGFCLNFRVGTIVACWECKLGGEGLSYLRHQLLLVWYIAFARSVKKGHLIGVERFFSKINGSCHLETSLIISVVYTAPNGYHYIIVLFGLDHEFYFILILFFLSQLSSAILILCLLWIYGLYFETKAWLLSEFMVCVFWLLILHKLLNLNDSFNMQNPLEERSLLHVNQG